MLCDSPDQEYCFCPEGVQNLLSENEMNVMVCLPDREQTTRNRDERSTASTRPIDNTVFLLNHSLAQLHCWCNSAAPPPLVKK